MNLSARAHKNLQSALAGALLGGLMASPRAGAAAVLNGLTAFTQGVLPFLFPFSCLAQLLACGRRAPLWALRLTGMLGGSPTGARLLAEVGDERAARRSAMMTGGVSPMFFAGTLALWLDSRADGTILLASHLGALALGGLLLPRGQARDIQTPEVSPPQAVAQSVLAMLSVGGCIAMGALAAALTGAFLPDVPRALLHAALEMSGGCRAIISLAWPRVPTLCLISAACAFSGAAILFQNAGYWRGVGISVVRLAGYGVIRAALSAALTFVMICICQAMKIAV